MQVLARRPGVLVNVRVGDRRVLLTDVGYTGGSSGISNNTYIDSRKLLRTTHNVDKPEIKFADLLPQVGDARTAVYSIIAQTPLLVQ